MQYGVILPLMDPRMLAELAREAEQAGWDGIFVWDGIWGIDPWIALAAIAMVTERVRIGTMLTPVSRRRPWKLASEAVTLDHLSNGRVILPVGLGAPDTGFDKVGEQTDRKIRAQLLDEGLDILTGFWSGQPFSYDGKHYSVHDVTFSPKPVQQPRIPLWVVGAWPRPKSMRRALRCDGVLPVKMNDDGAFAPITPADIEAITSFIAQHRAQTAPFDIVLEDEAPSDDRKETIAKIRPFAEVGVTWWLDNPWADPRRGNEMRSVEEMRTRIKQGPPRIDG